MTNSRDADIFAWIDQSLPGNAKLPGPPLRVSNPAYPDEMLDNAEYANTAGKADRTAPIPPRRPGRQPAQREASSARENSSRREAAPPLPPSRSAQEPSARGGGDVEQPRSGVPLPPVRPADAPAINARPISAEPEVPDNGRVSPDGVFNTGMTPKDGFYGDPSVDAAQLQKNEEQGMLDNAVQPSFKQEVLGAQEFVQQLERAGIDPNKITAVQREQIRQLGLARWIAGQKRNVIDNVQMRGTR